MHARYDRMVNERVLPSLLPGGAYAFLVAEMPGDDPDALDVQLRERNKLMFYHGTTRVLTVQFRARSNGVDARAHAAAAYGEHPGCQNQYLALMNPTWTSVDAAAFRAAFLAYLPAAIAAADAGHDRNQREGYWQNRLCRRYGRHWTPNDEWLFVDRECVIGFNNTDERQAFYERIRTRHQGVRDRLQQADPAVWGAPDGKVLGNELDLLAINRGGDLVAIELKHGQNASGIYWSPLQVGVYRDAFETILGSIRGSLQKLVQQKIALGLLPAAASRLLAASGLKRVEPIVAVADPDEHSACWQKMADVIAEMDRAGIPRSAPPLRIAKVRAGRDDVAIAFAPASPCDGAA